MNSMLMRLKLCVGNGRQVIKLCHRVLQYYATVATELVGYVLYRALVEDNICLSKKAVLDEKLLFREQSTPCTV